MKYILLLLFFILAFSNVSLCQDCKHEELDTIKAGPGCLVQPGTLMYQCRKCNMIIELSSGDTLVLTDEHGDTLVAPSLRSFTPIALSKDKSIGIDSKYVDSRVTETILTAYEEYKVVCYNDSTLSDLRSFKVSHNGRLTCIDTYYHETPTFEGFMEWLSNKK